MKRVLVLGLSPLPTENDTCTLAPGKRTWQFVRPLLEDGNRLCLICSRHLAAYKNVTTEPAMAEEHGNLIYYSVRQEIFENSAWLQRIHDNFEPDCIVGATIFPSYMATQLITDRPIWADLFGHVMAEAQTKSQVFRDNYYISQLWRQEESILDRADVLSVVSNPQSYATIGELGTRFRLNRATTGYQFTRVIPCSMNENLPLDPPSEPVLRGVLVPRDAFIILWSGGYNTWTDVNTLFEALERVFQRFPQVYFVSTGGEIASHDELTYKHFLNRIEGSEFRNRFVMRGWIPFNEVPACVQESDIGINIDLFSYEGILGSRNRLMDWMQMRLPIVTSELCELSRVIRQEALGSTFQPEDTEGLVSVITEAIHNPEFIKSNAERAFVYCDSHFSVSATTKPLIEWVRNPLRAPDHSDSLVNENSFQKLKAVSRHYHASIMNNIRTGGLLHTIRWMFGRSPLIRRFIRMS
ncbi:glycosyltransferase [bacterium]|nr:glycosyltransferase [candidate division CSSED10-310 bacterium]